MLHRHIVALLEGHGQLQAVMVDPADASRIVESTPVLDRAKK